MSSDWPQTRVLNSSEPIEENKSHQLDARVKNYSNIVCLKIDFIASVLYLPIGPELRLWGNTIQPFIKLIIFNKQFISYKNHISIRELLL